MKHKKFLLIALICIIGIGISFLFFLLIDHSKI